MYSRIANIPRRDICWNVCLPRLILLFITLQENEIYKGLDLMIGNNVLQVDKSSRVLVHVQQMEIDTII